MHSVYMSNCVIGCGHHYSDLKYLTECTHEVGDELPGSLVTNNLLREPMKLPDMVMKEAFFHTVGEYPKLDLTYGSTR